MTNSVPVSTNKMSEIEISINLKSKNWLKKCITAVLILYFIVRYDYSFSWHHLIKLKCVHSWNYDMSKSTYMFYNFNLLENFTYKALWISYNYDLILIIYLLFFRIISFYFQMIFFKLSTRFRKLIEQKYIVSHLNLVFQRGFYFLSLIKEIL